MLRLIVQSLLLTSAVHGVAWACSCAPDFRSIEEEMASRELIVWGEVLPEAEPQRSGCQSGPAEPSSRSFYEVRFQVLEGFVGAEAGDELTFEVRQGTTCTAILREGERWFVLLDPGEGLSRCNPSHQAEEGDEALEAFRAYVAP